MIYKLLKNFYKQTRSLLLLKKKDSLLTNNDFFNFFEGLILNIAIKNNGAKIIQIGSSDGVTGDPLQRIVKKNNFQIKLLAIEPMKKSFIKLKENYEGYNNVFFSNNLVADGTVKRFYFFNDNFNKFNVDGNKEGLSSTNKDSVLRQMNRRGLTNFEKYVNYQDIQSYTLKKIIDSVPEMKDPDILQIDAEGSDDEIIYSCFKEKLNFQIINYEAKLLTIEKKKKLHNFFEKANYKVIKWKKSDEVAIKI